MEELEKKIIEILDQFQMEAAKIWPTSQFSILGVKIMILSELKKLEKPKGE